MAWIASLASAGAGIYSANKSAEAGKDASGMSANAIKKAYGQAQSGLAPYSGLGPGAANDLGALMGIEGYRTPADIALREHLAAKPVNKYGFVPSKRGAAEELLHSNWDLRNASKVERSLGLDKSPLTLSGMGSSRRKKDAIRAADEKKAALNKYMREMSAWEAKTQELTKQRDVELQSYDPTSKLRQTPGYQYRYDTGLGATENYLNKLGISQSGRAQKELTQYGQDFGSNEYQNEFNRLTGLMGAGQNAQTTLANLSVGQGTSLANIYGQQGANNAATYGNYNNVIQGSLSNLLANNNQNNQYGSSYTSNSTNPYNDPNYWPD
jgi:hypothetical protein